MLPFGPPLPPRLLEAIHSGHHARRLAPLPRVGQALRPVEAVLGHRRAARRQRLVRLRRRLVLLLPVVAVRQQAQRGAAAGRHLGCGQGDGGRLTCPAAATQPARLPRQRRRQQGPPHPQHALQPLHRLAQAAVADEAVEQAGVGRRNRHRGFDWARAAWRSCWAGTFAAN